MTALPPSPEIKLAESKEIKRSRVNVRAHSKAGTLLSRSWKSGISGVKTKYGPL
jgi:hypothetical protein